MPTMSLAELRELVHSFVPDRKLSLAEERDLLDGTPQPVPTGTTVESWQADSVTGEYLRRSGSMRTLLWLHGGGYRTGSSKSARGLAAGVACSINADCLCIDYRRAPENPFPAAVEDGLAAYDWMVRQRGDRPLVVGGDSAGGGLAAAVVVATPRRRPGAVLLLAPWLDLTMSGESVTSRREVDFMLTESGLTESAAQYAAGRSLDDPLVSPLFADLQGFPPVYIQVGDADLLLDDSVRFATRVQTAGGVCTLDVVPEMPHVFQTLAGFLPEARHAISRMAAWVSTITPT